MKQFFYYIKILVIDLKRLKNMSFDCLTPKVASIEKEIDLKSNAENDGRNDLPGVDSGVFSNCENEAITKYDDVRHKCLTDAAKYLEPIKENITILKSKLEQKHFYIDEFKNRIEESLTTAKGKLSTLKSSFDVQDKEVRNFKLANNLTRDPQTLTPLKIIGAFLLVAALFGLEAKVNQALLRDALPGGGIAALSISGSVAALNVFISFLAGYFVLKNFHSVINFRRRISQIGLLIYSFFIFYLNICLGAYRAAAELKGDAVAWGETEAKVTEMADYGDVLLPWTVEWSFYAAVLTFIGISFALFSLLDGYFFNDPYPGYGSLGKNRNENKKEINRIREYLATEINGISKNEIKKTGDQRDLLISKNLIDWSKNITILENVFSNYRRFAKKIDDDLDHVIGEYRSLNSMFRKPNSEPQYWKDENGKIKTRYYNMPNSKLNPEEVFTDTAILYLNKDQIQKQMKEYQEKISEESNQYINKLHEYHVEINKTIKILEDDYNVNDD